MNSLVRCAAFAGVVLACVSTAHAVEIETVLVGNPGNAGELSGGSVPGGYGDDRICGAVDYVYEIAKFEVTAGQYAEFLNAVGGEDLYGLYNPWMETSGKGCQIQQTGALPDFTYSVAAEWADRPVNYVSWADAARFANWLHNGQPTGSQDLTTTEDGSYYLNGAVSDPELAAVEREPDATWVIPSEDEWYKAAYHFNDGVTGNYFDYPTRTDGVPASEPCPGGANSANYDGNGGDPGGSACEAPHIRCEVGCFNSSPGPYGTFDQGGNVWEWTEAIFTEPSGRGVRGGSWKHNSDHMLAAWRLSETSGFDTPYDGIRLARVHWQDPPPTRLDLRIDIGSTVGPPPSGENWNTIQNADINGLTENLIDYATGLSTQVQVAGSGWSLGGGSGALWLCGDVDWAMRQAVLDGIDTLITTGIFTVSNLDDAKRYRVEVISAHSDTYGFHSDIQVQGVYGDRNRRNDSCGTGYHWNARTCGCEYCNWPIWDAAAPVGGQITVSVTKFANAGYINAMHILEVYTDCNNNGIPDVQDIAAATSQDCNLNGTPDECDIANCDGDQACGDCNANGIPDACDFANGAGGDLDTDGIYDACDNCPNVSNEDQANSDGDSHGDACDNCPNDDNEDQANCDGDEFGDVCDDDRDGDGVPNAVDVCPDTPHCDVMPDGRPRLDLDNDCDVGGLDIGLIVQEMLEGCSECG